MNKSAAFDLDFLFVPLSYVHRISQAAHTKPKKTFSPVGRLAFSLTESCDVAGGRQGFMGNGSALLALLGQSRPRPDPTRPALP